MLRRWPALGMDATGQRVFADEGNECFAPGLAPDTLWARPSRAGQLMLQALAANRQNNRFIESALNESFKRAHDWHGSFENLFVAGVGVDGLRHVPYQQVRQFVVCCAVRAVGSAFLRTAGKGSASHCGVDWRQRVHAGGCAITPPDRLASAGVRW